MRRLLYLLITVAVAGGCADRSTQQEATTVAFPPAPAGLDNRLSTYFEVAKAHQNNVWRDIPTLNPDGTVNGYVEIPKGESTKWEFRIQLNRREIDRMIPAELGGYPINYGFMPQTISYDGDPADVLVLGPTLEGGTVVKGRIVALMGMMDTGDIDSKVVISPLDASGAPLYALEPAHREQMERFFNTYKNHDGKVTKITGWHDADAALNFITRTSGFFNAGRK